MAKKQRKDKPKHDKQVTVARNAETYGNGTHLLELPEEILRSIKFFLPGNALFHFISCNKYLYGLYKSLTKSSLDNIRLYYLNKRSELQVPRTKIPGATTSFSSEVDLPNSYVEPLNPSGIYDLLNPDVWNQFAEVKPLQTFFKQFEECNREDIPGHYYEKLILNKLFSNDHLEDRKNNWKEVVRCLLPVLFQSNKSNVQQFVIGGSTVFFSMQDSDENLDQNFDVDIFLLENGCSQQDSHKLLKTVLLEFEKIALREGLKYCVMKNKATLNIVPHGHNPHNCVQFVLRRVSNSEELLSFLDLDCTRFIFNGSQLLTNIYGIRSKYLQENILEKAVSVNYLYSTRQDKYASRGIATRYTNGHPLDHLMDLETYRRAIQSHPNFTVDINWEDEDDQYNNTNVFSYNVIMDIRDHGVDYALGRRASRFIELNKKNPHIFAANLQELYQTDYSYWFLDGYYESHLRSKYLMYRCYICSCYWKMNHPPGSPHFSERNFCYQCHQMNENNRNSQRNMSGMVAIVTGGRIKIGYAAALKMLRCGAEVIITTRFKQDAIERYRKEPDFSSFQRRLNIYPLNLKDGQSVLEFIKFLKTKYDRIHILINNAAQTVRRPLPYYQSLLKKEKRKLDIQDTTRKVVNSIAIPGSSKLNRNNSYADTLRTNPSEVALTPLITAQLRSVKATESLHMIDEDFMKKEVAGKLFPARKYDEFGEQLDVRKLNSWNQELEEVHDIELLEVQMVNQIVPTMLVSKLLPLMEVVPGKTTKGPKTPSYIINVTSHEGSFHTLGKTDHHIHTNISKAALNMLTRSAAPYYAKKGILMNSVDTGWVSSAISTFKKPPLTCEDGAARILHPICSESTDYGQLLKNYSCISW